ncbi:MAG TPA: GDP-mannose 4,6-dehydratase [Herpetosiphonaceae bacterium]
MTRALITGAGGFAGRHLLEYLRAATDWELWGVTRSGASLPGGARAATCDLLDAPAVAALIAETRPDFIFHLAAQSFVPASFDDPAGTLTTNLLSQLNLFQAVGAAKIDPVVLAVSSNEIYGLVRPEDVPVGELTPFRPVNPYAVSKAAQDLLAGQWFHSHKLRVVRARPFNHIGPGQRENFVAPAFARQIALIERGLQPPVVRVGNLDAQRDFTDVRDVVRAYHLAAVSGEPGAAYNIGSGRPVAIRSLLDILVSLSSAPIEIELDPARLRPADVPLVACDASALRQRTGWTPAIRLEDTLRDILDEWRASVAGEPPTPSP